MKLKRETVSIRIGSRRRSSAVRLLATALGLIAFAVNTYSQSSGSQVETVKAQAGDTVETLAQRYGIDAKELAKINGLLPNSVIFAGRELRLKATVPSGNKSADRPLIWKPVGIANDKTTISYRNYSARMGRAEAWLKWEPKIPLKSWGLGSAAYYLQYSTVDCDGKRITLESTIFYDKNDRIIPSRYSFAFNTFNQPVLPDSVGEMIWHELCIDDEPQPELPTTSVEKSPPLIVGPEVRSTPEKAAVVRVTSDLKILAKPKPSYTDSAREARTSGIVILRVTFLASGTIGSISPVKALPNGLTEEAISAARNIRFEPAMKNGVPQTVIRELEYSFPLY